jgi:hypothetical protein
MEKRLSSHRVGTWRRGGFMTCNGHESRGAEDSVAQNMHDEPFVLGEPCRTPHKVPSSFAATQKFLRRNYSQRPALTRKAACCKVARKRAAGSYDLCRPSHFTVYIDARTYVSNLPHCANHKTLHYLPSLDPLPSSTMPAANWLDYFSCRCSIKDQKQGIGSASCDIGHGI